MKMCIWIILLTISN